jgi:hypothetical protein
MELNAKKLGVALAGSGLLLGLQGAASAHFVWLEPATDAGAVKACFGEYPELREGAPLLEKVQRVRVFALQDGQRRELKQEAQDNHYLYREMRQAPVAVADLTYGILQRGDTPPYLLRYEAQLLRGSGKAMPLARIAELSRQDTGLPFTARLAAGKPGSAVLSLRLAGKPVAGEVACVVGGATEAEKLKTDAEGKIELPVKAGWNHWRISAEDGKPVTVEGKEGKFTRTYLSLMFEAEAPAAGQQAAAVQVDADAVKLLDEAHRARANWPDTFPGFTVDAVYSRNGKTARGRITVGADFKVKYELGDPELEQALSPSFGSLVSHRTGGESHYDATWKDAETNPQGRAINLNDNLGSFYRVRDRQIMQVNRRMANQHFTTNVFENEDTKLGFLPLTWSVAYFSNDSDALLRVSTTRVTWKWIGEIFVPATMDVVDNHGNATEVSHLELANARLLSK